MQGDAPDGRRGSAAIAAARELVPVTPRQLAAAGALALAYWAAAFASPVLRTDSSADIALWLPAGVALAGLVLGGVRLWPGVLAGQLLAGLGLDIASAAILAAGATLAAAIPAAILKARKTDPGLGDLRSVLWFVLAGGILGATLLTMWALLEPTRGWPLGADDVRTLRFRWQGTLAGALVVAPVIMSWRAGAPRPWRPVSYTHLTLPTKRIV